MDEPVTHDRTEDDLSPHPQVTPEAVTHEDVFVVQSLFCPNEVRSGTRHKIECPAACDEVEPKLQEPPSRVPQGRVSTRMTFRRQRQQVKQVSASTTSAPISGTTLQMKPVKISAEVILELIPGRSRKGAREVDMFT